MNKLRIDNNSINRQCIPSSSLKIGTSSSKRFHQASLGTRFHDIIGIIARGFYHGKVNGLACENYERYNL